MLADHAIRKLVELHLRALRVLRGCSLSVTLCSSCPSWLLSFRRPGWVASRSAAAILSMRVGLYSGSEGLGNKRGGDGGQAALRECLLAE